MAAGPAVCQGGAAPGSGELCRPALPPEQEMPGTGHLDTPGLTAPSAPPEPTVGLGALGNVPDLPRCWGQAPSEVWREQRWGRSLGGLRSTLPLRHHSPEATGMANLWVSAWLGPLCSPTMVRLCRWKLRCPPSVPMGQAPRLGTAPGVPQGAHRAQSLASPWAQGRSPTLLGTVLTPSSVGHVSVWGNGAGGGHAVLAPSSSPRLTQGSAGQGEPPSIPAPSRGAAHSPPACFEAAGRQEGAPFFVVAATFPSPGARRREDSGSGDPQGV